MPNITTLFEGTDGVSRTLFNQKLSDINAHGNDATMHVTMAERAAWGGKANGNNAVWTATSVAISDGDHGYTLTVPNFILTNGCQVTFKSPNDVQETQWLWVTINSGNLYAVRTVGQEILPAAAWKVNSMVTLTISVTDPFYVGDGVGGRNGYAFFKGGSGSIKEMFTFPLSIQTAEPTPLDTNHIWIQNATKRRIVFDDAIRSSPPGDSYWFIQDNMDNSFVYLQSPIKTTDNITLNSILRKGNRDTITWRLSERGGTNGSGHVFAKKNGVDYYSDIDSKWPRIMSRVGSTINVESAKRWDGSAWQWLSQKGAYLISPKKIFYRNEGVLSNPKDFNIYGISVAVSPDGNYIATCGASNLVRIYTRNGDSFSTYADVPCPAAVSIATCQFSFSPDSNYLAVCATNNSNTAAYILKKQGPNTWSSIAIIDDAMSVCWSSNGSQLIKMYPLSGTGTTKIYYYNRNGDSFTESGVVKTALPYSFQTMRIKAYGNRVAFLQMYASNVYKFGFVSGDTSVEAPFGGYIQSKYVNSMFDFVDENVAVIVADSETASYLFLYNMVTKTIVASYTVKNSAAYVQSIAISRDRKFVFASCSDKTIAVFSVTSSTISYIGSTDGLYSYYSLACW